jgi:hypothetical protein
MDTIDLTIDFTNEANDIFSNIHQKRKEFGYPEISDQEILCKALNFYLVNLVLYEEFSS